MIRVFLDTGYLIALEAINDQHHKKAKEHWLQFAQDNPLLVTSTFVFDEITTFFNNRNHHSKAAEIGKKIITHPSIELIHIDEKIFSESWEYFQLYQDIVFCICSTSFAANHNKKSASSLSPKVE